MSKIVENSTGIEVMPVLIDNVNKNWIIKINS